MKQKKILFIDRDGTLIEEPADEQIDAFEKLKFKKGVFRNLSFIREHTDYLFVMVSNQDGLGTDSFPENTFWPVHNFILQTLESESAAAPSGRRERVSSRGRFPPAEGTQPL